MIYLFVGCATKNCQRLIKQDHTVSCMLVKMHDLLVLHFPLMQESIASELANRMNAMNNASDNARDLKKNLTQLFNRNRQAKITGEILEIVAGANA